MMESKSAWTEREALLAIAAFLLCVIFKSPIGVALVSAGFSISRGLAKQGGGK